MKKPQPMLHGRRPHAASLIACVAIVFAFLLAGCAVRPQALKDEDVRKRTAADQYLLYAEQEPITGPIDVNTAIARALKYNLDYRLKLMERALATGLWEVSRYDMLPKVVASAGYAWRNNDSGGTSVSIINGQETLSPSTSQERNRWLANAEFSWNLLDFGVSYYQAKQKADETLISEERRRRVIQNIVQDTRSAYWRAVGAQRLAKKADDVLVRVKTALEKSRQAESMGLLPPVQALNYQRDLLDAATQLNIRRQELEFSKRELAALMNVTPGTDFTLADEKEPGLPQPPRNVGELEEVALQSRPELREEDYRKRISVAETHKAILSLLPGISFDFAGRYDSNKYLYNQNWIDGGVQVFANLMRLLAYPSVKKANEARIAADDARRVALSMAVITQVRVAIQRYALSLVDLDLAEQATQVDSRLARYARVATTMRVDSELELVRSEARALIGEFQRYASYANAQAAYGRILNSLGVDVLPDAIDRADVNSLAVAVAAQIGQAARDTFPVALSPVLPQLPSIRVSIENVKSQSLKLAATEAAIRVLRSAGYDVDGADPKAWTLHMSFDMARASGGVGRGRWDIRLERSDGTVAGRAEYSSPLAAQFQPSTMDAFTDAATASQLHSLNGWLRNAASPVGARMAEAEATQGQVPKDQAEKAPGVDTAVLSKPVEAWAKAWSAQDVERYLGAYAPGFKPADGGSRRAWERQRRARVSAPGNVHVSVSEMRVLQRTDRRAEVTFRQDYRSDQYHDSVRKKLELVRDGERWLIAEEQVVATLAGPDPEQTTRTANAWTDEKNSVNREPIAAVQVQQSDPGDVQQNAPTAPRQSLVAETKTPDAEDSVVQDPIAAAPVQQSDLGKVQRNLVAASHQNVIAATKPIEVTNVRRTERQPEPVASSTEPDTPVRQETVVGSAKADTAAHHTLPSEGSEPGAGSLKAPVLAWARAWAAKDVERYLDAYAPSFTPADGGSRRTWEMLRRERVTEAKNIQVSVSDVKVLRRTNGRAEVTFRQDYRSDHYQDSVRKRLELVRDGERWLIAEEQVVGTLTGGPSAEPTTESATALSDKKNPVNQVPIAAAPVQQGDVGDVQQNAATEAPPTVLAELQTSTENGVPQMEAKAQAGEDSARRDPAVAVPQQRTVELAEADTAPPHTLPKNPSEQNKRARLQAEQSCKRGGIEFPRYEGRCLY